MAQGGELVGAEWGVPGRRVDVTARVRTFIHDGVLQLEVTRFNLGIDPAPGEIKVLVVRLREWDGDIRDYSYAERSWARLELDPRIGTNGASGKSIAKKPTTGTREACGFCAPTTEPTDNS